MVSLSGCYSSHETDELKRVNEELKEYLNLELSQTYHDHVKIRFEGSYDTEVRWISIPYEEAIWEEIKTSNPDLKLYDGARGAFTRVDAPNWFRYDRESDVYVKTDFLDRTFSEVYLWKVKEDRICMYVHFFD